MRPRRPRTEADGAGLSSSTTCWSSTSRRGGRRLHRDHGGGAGRDRPRPAGRGSRSCSEFYGPLKASAVKRPQRAARRGAHGRALREVRPAHGRALGPLRALPGLQRLPGLPDGAPPPGEEERRRSPTETVTSAARRWWCASAATARFLACSRYPECKGTKPPAHQGGRGLPEVPRRPGRPAHPARPHLLRLRQLPPLPVCDLVAAAGGAMPQLRRPPGGGGPRARPLPELLLARRPALAGDRGRIRRRVRAGGRQSELGAPCPARRTPRRRGKLPGGSAWEALLDGYLRDLRAERNLSPYTLRNYATDLRAFIDFVEEEGGDPLQVDRHHATSAPGPAHGGGRRFGEPHSQGEHHPRLLPRPGAGRPRGGQPLSGGARPEAAPAAALLPQQRGCVSALISAPETTPLSACATAL